MIVSGKNLLVAAWTIAFTKIIANFFSVLKNKNQFKLSKNSKFLINQHLFEQACLFSPDST